MKAVFMELPPFMRVRANYLDDEGLRGLQNALIENPDAGDVIEGGRAAQDEVCGRPAWQR